MEEAQVTRADVGDTLALRGIQPSRGARGARETPRAPSARSHRRRSSTSPVTAAPALDKLPRSALPARPALAVRGQQVCDPTEDGAECRQALLVGDETSGSLGGYEEKSKKKFEAAKASTNPDLTNYQKDTLVLVEEVEQHHNTLPSGQDRADMVVEEQEITILEIAIVLLLELPTLEVVVVPRLIDQMVQEKDLMVPVAQDFLPSDLRTLDDTSS